MAILQDRHRGGVALALLLIGLGGPNTALGKEDPSVIGRVKEAESEPRLVGGADGDDEDEFLTVNAPILVGDDLATEDGTVAIELLGGRLLSLAANTTLRIDEADRFALGEGAIVIASAGEHPVEVSTYQGAVRIEQSALVRIDAYDGTLTLEVEKGVALLLGEGEEVDEIHAGAGLRVHPETGDRTEFDARIGRDAFGRKALSLMPRDIEGTRGSESARYFSKEREEQFEVPEETVIIEEHIEYEVPLGYDELDEGGSWVMAEGDMVWMPRVQDDWQPYSDGDWIWRPSFGWVWVSAAPWGYVTHHYGRWRYTYDFGWVWVPGRVWAPAWVHWGAFDSHLGWSVVTYRSAPFGVSLSFGTRQLSSWVLCDSVYFEERRYRTVHTRSTRRFYAPRAGLRFENRPALVPNPRRDLRPRTRRYTSSYRLREAAQRSRSTRGSSRGLHDRMRSTGAREFRPPQHRAPSRGVERSRGLRPERLAPPRSTGQRDAARGWDRRPSRERGLTPPPASGERRSEDRSSGGRGSTSAPERRRAWPSRSAPAGSKGKGEGRVPPPTRMIPDQAPLSSAARGLPTTQGSRPQGTGDRWQSRRMAWENSGTKRRGSWSGTERSAAHNPSALPASRARRTSQPLDGRTAKPSTPTPSISRGRVARSDRSVVSPGASPRAESSSNRAAARTSRAPRPSSEVGRSTPRRSRSGVSPRRRSSRRR